MTLLNKLINKFVLPAALTITSVPVFANNPCLYDQVTDKSILCPSAQEIKSHSELDTVTSLDSIPGKGSRFAVGRDGYIVTEESNKTYRWDIATGVESQDWNNAYIDGVNNIKNVTDAVCPNPIAIKDPQTKVVADYLCFYNTSNAPNARPLVYAKSSRNYDGKYNFAKFDFKSLHLKSY